MTPTLAQIIAHQPKGGLWRAIPERTEEGQPRPILARLDVRIARGGDIATIEGGDLAATIAENANLQGAKWVPCDSRGDRI
jgi:hypothetical protein